MAEIFTIKQHDTHPPLDAVLTMGAPPTPVDLTGATVKLLLKTATGTATVGACTIVSAAAGSVRYQWVAGDTASVETFSGEFEVTWGDGKITTFPNDGYFTVVVKPDLG